MSPTWHGGAGPAHGLLPADAGNCRQYCRLITGVGPPSCGRRPPITFRRTCPSYFREFLIDFIYINNTHDYERMTKLIVFDKTWNFIGGFNSNRLIEFINCAVNVFVYAVNTFGFCRFDVLEIDFLVVSFRVRKRPTAKMWVNVSVMFFS